MVLDPQAAQRFINTYMAVLLAIAGTPTCEDKKVLHLLVKGRARLLKDPALLEKARCSLAEQSQKLDHEVMSAIEGLEVRKWVYLRDTRAYSVFLDSSTDRAFGVVGLTDRLSDVVGGSGAFVETGLVRFNGRFVCDGLFTQIVWLGTNVRKSCNEKFLELKRGKQFFVRQDA